MDFSEDLTAKQKGTFSSQVASQFIHCPLALNISCSEETLPSIHELGILPKEVQKSPISAPVESSPSLPDDESNHISDEPLFDDQRSARRCRISSFQKEELNKVFIKSFFPSTEIRAQLAFDLNMTPRAVQIWFQNKRQAWRSKHKPGPILMNSVNGKTSISNMNPYFAPRSYTSLPFMPPNEPNFCYLAPDHHQ